MIDLHNWRKFTCQTLFFFIQFFLIILEIMKILDQGLVGEVF